MTTLDNPSNLPDPATVPLRPTALRYGLIAGLILIVFSVIFNMTGMMDYSGQKSNILPNLCNWITMIGVLYMAIKHHRDEELGGYITLGRCVKLGAFMAIVIGAITGIFGILYFMVIDPGLPDQIFAQMEEGFAAQGMDENAAEMAMKWTKMMFKPIPLFFVSVIATLITMLIISLIVGAIMKKNPPAMA
jgi:hypothetical protein